MTHIRPASRWIIDESRLRDLLEALARGEQSVADTVDRLRHLPYEDLGYAQIGRAHV